eukprot:40175_1
MSFPAILVSIENTIIYYYESKKLHSFTIQCDYNIPSSQQTEKYNVPRNGVLLLSSIQEATNNDIESAPNEFRTIDLSFDDTTNGKFCFQQRLNITVGIVVQYTMDRKHQIDETLLNIFGAIYGSIQQFLFQSTQIPVYILRVRCHVLSQQLLFHANHPSIASCNCCKASEQYASLRSDTTELPPEPEEESEQKTQSRASIELRSSVTSQSTNPQPRSSYERSSLSPSYQKPTLRTLFENIQNASNESGRLRGYDYLFKIVIIGDESTGKSCLLLRFTDDMFDTEYVATIGVDFRFKTITIDHKIIKLQIWDTAGQERFKTVTTAYYRGAHGLLITYDVTCRESFEHVQDWIYEAQRYASPNVKRVLVGCKYDAGDQRVVTAEEGQRLAEKYCIPFYETSAKMDNVNTPFVALAKDLATLTRHTASEQLQLSRAPVMMMASRSKKSTFVMPSLPEFKREKQEDTTLIDNVFADLENMFYLLSDMIYYVMLDTMDSACNIICNIFRFVAWFIVYPLVFVLCTVVVLPSCIFLLIVRMNKIETDTTNVEMRELVIEHETCCERMVRLMMQLIRALFMFGVLCIYPVVIVYVIIPKYGHSDAVVLTSIGTYLFFILGLQIFATYRGFKSFYEKRKHVKMNGDDEDHSEFMPRRFIWNVGSWLGILMIMYEVNQMAVFALHTINDKQEATNDTALSGINAKLRNILTSVSFFVSGQLEQIPILECYVMIGMCCVGALILFFELRLIFELRQYARYKHIEYDRDKARSFYFHSFVGSIIYGHARLQNVSQFTAKIVSFISDAAFLGICEKLIVILVCNSTQNGSYLIVDNEETICWTGKHQHYAAICLVLIGYYIPLSAMISPMFDEDGQRDKKESWMSMANSVYFVKPFIAAVTCTKCFMLISATFMLKGAAIGTIACNCIVCLILFVFTLKWSFVNLNQFGLTQNEPGFPFGASLIRALGFFAAIVGSVVELLKVCDVIDSSVDVILLMIIMIVASMSMLYLLWRYHRKFNRYDDDVDVKQCLEYDRKTKTIQFISNSQQ